MIPWVRTTLGREEITLGVGICCGVYVCEYGSIGRRSEADRCLEERYRSLWLTVGSIPSVYRTRPGVGSYCGAQLYHSSTQPYTSAAAKQVFI